MSKLANHIALFCSHDTTRLRSAMFSLATLVLINECKAKAQLNHIHDPKFQHSSLVSSSVYSVLILHDNIGKKSTDTNVLSLYRAHISDIGSSRTRTDGEIYIVYK